MRILYVIDGLGAGGKERQLVEILRYLSPTDVEAGVVTFKKHQPYTETVKQYTDLFAEVDKSSRLKPIGEISKLIGIFKPDIVQSWDSMSSFYSYRSSKKHNTFFIDGSIRDAGVEKGWQYTFKRYFLKRAALIIANSQAGLNYYKVKGKVIYNAIDRKRFVENSSSDEFNMIMSANFTDYKDHDTFIKASIKLIRSKIVDNVFLPGAGKHLERIKASVPSELQSKFHFPGRISNIENYLAKSKVGVLTSTSIHGEGVSNSVLEYMAGELVPVVTDIGGSSEIIENGKNGFLVSEKDVSTIIEKVTFLKNNTESFDRMKQEALKTIEEKFDMKTNITKLLSLYTDLINSSNPQTAS